MPLLTLAKPPIALLQYPVAVKRTAGLVAYQRLGEGSGAGATADASGNGKTGTPASVTFGATGLLTGDGGTAATFNGTSSQVTFDDGTFFNYDRTQAWTVECVVKPNVTRSGTPAANALFSKMLAVAPFTGIQVGLVYNPTANVGARTVVEVWLISSFGGGTYIQLWGSTDLANGTKYHVSVSYDGSGLAAGVSIAINGAVEPMYVQSDTLGANAITNAATARIGSRNGAAQWGKFDLEEVALYNQAVPVETRALHARRAFRADPVPTLVADLAGAPAVILDTDMAGDVDDVGDLAALHAMVTLGEATIAGVITSSASPYAAPCCQAINAHYGRGSTPIGAYQGSATPSTAGLYAQTITNTFGTNGDTRANYTDATTQYRTILAAAPNASVVVVMTGFAAPFAALLASSADGISGLTGSQLVAAKVKRVVVVAGYYPSNTRVNKSAESNFANDKANWISVFANCPVEIVCAGIELGDAVKTGPPSGADPLTNPIKKAYDLWGAPTRQAWGQLGVLFAVRGSRSGLVALNSLGTNTVNASTGANAWSSTAGLVAYLQKVQADPTLVTVLNALVTG